MTTKSNQVAGIVSAVAIVAVVALSIFWYFNRQFINDQLSVWSFTPSSEIETINGRISLTEKGTFVFYATQPVVASQQQFNDTCPREETTSPVLGCYTHEDRIYIYNVSNDQLDGMKEVTAAHEMLHAVWHRMSASEQEKISVLLKDRYEQYATTALKDRMAYYERVQPEEVVNELHSILPTEVADIGPELEAYYSQFFEKRSEVVALHKKYNDIYVQLTTRADEIFSQMDTLQTEITTRNEQYAADTTQLQVDITSFNQRAQQGSFTSMSQFYNERSRLVARVDQLEAEKQSLNESIELYNNLHQEYDKIADQIEVLNDSLDSMKTVDAPPSFT